MTDEWRETTRKISETVRKSWHWFDILDGRWVFFSGLAFVVGVLLPGFTFGSKLLALAPVLAAIYFARRQSAITYALFAEEVQVSEWKRLQEKLEVSAKIVMVLGLLRADPPPAPSQKIHLKDLLQETWVEATRVRFSKEIEELIYHYLATEPGTDDGLTLTQIGNELRKEHKTTDDEFKRSLLEHERILSTLRWPGITTAEALRQTRIRGKPTA